MVRGLMAITDLVTIIGALKRSKSVLFFWIFFAIVNIVVDIFRCVAELEKDSIILGFGYGYDSLKRGC